MQSTTRNYLLLFLGCLLFHLAGTWIVPLIDRDEPRFSEASREMMERNDYVIPYFNNQYRFDKPPFTYWAQVVSYRIFGQHDFSARFPSAMAAALAALVIFAWGSRMGNDRTGFWAAIIFTLSLQTVEHAKAAVADMWLVLFVTLAHWAGYELFFSSEKQRSTLNSESFREQAAQRSTFNEEHAAPDSRWWWIFYIALALAFLAKGPIGWTPVITVALTMLFVRSKLEPRFSFIIGTIVTLAGIVLTVAIVSLWGIPALIQTHGQYWQIGIGRHVLGRSISTMGGHGAKSFGTYLLLLPFYFVTIFLSFFPWSIKLPWLAQRLRRERDLNDIYLLCGAAVIFVIFTLVTTRLLHYTLPAFPLLALLLARALTQEQPNRFLKKCALIIAPIYIGLALFVSPLIAQFFPARELFRQSCADLQPDMEFGAVEFTEPSIVWYFRSRVNKFMTLLDRKNVDSFMAEEGPRFVILPTDAATNIFPNPPSDWKMFSTRGFNAVKGKRSDLTLVLKPE